MIKTRSDALLVWLVNTSAAGGSAVTITNSSNLFITNTSLTVVIQNSGGLFAQQSGAWAVSSTILNSAGWVVNVANTGGGMTVLNSGGLFAMQSGAWTVSSTILNSAGWVVNVANTGGAVAILNSGGLFANQSGTWTVGISNSAGWVFAQSNTNNQGVIIQNSGGLFAMQSGAWAVSSTILNSAGWTVGLVAGAALVGSINTINVGTGGSVNIINSAGWSFTQTNTASTQVTTYNTNLIYDGATALVMQYGTINITNSTNTVLVNAVTNLRIRVVSLMLISQGTGLVILQSGSSSGIGLTGPLYLAANVGFVLPFNPNGWMQTQTSTLLNFNLASATSVAGCLTYLTTS